MARLWTQNRSLIGAICGAFVAVTASWLVRDDNRNEDTTTVESAASTATAPTTQSVESNTPSNRPITQATDQDSPDVPTANVNSVESLSPWPANLREEFEAEPKDDSWAYYMEQTLLQFLGSHSSAAQFDISKVECRSTKCKIEVFGYDQSTVPVWQQVMYDIRQQPWNQFGHYGSSSGMTDGRLMIVGTFQRVPEK